MEGRYNTRSPAVKRLMREAQELSEPTDQYYAQPLEDNLFEWHFTVRGPADSDFQHGIYHGRIILPVDYPMKPPSIIWLTPNGRFETNKKICLSISGHHPESWQPSWSIRTALLAIIGFMPTRPGGAIGSLDYTTEERKVLAKRSQDWKCPSCGAINEILLERTPESGGPQASQEAKNLAAQIQFQGEKPKGSEGGRAATTATASTAQASIAPPTSIVAPSSPAVEHQQGGASAQPTTPLSPSLPPSIPSMFPGWGLPAGSTPGPGFLPPNMAWPGVFPNPASSAAADNISPVNMIPQFPFPPSQQPFPVPFCFPPTPLPPGIIPPGMFPMHPPLFPGGPQMPSNPAQVTAESTNNSSVFASGSGGPTPTQSESSGAASTIQPGEPGQGSGMRSSTGRNTPAAAAYGVAERDSGDDASLKSGSAGDNGFARHVTSHAGAAVVGHTGGDQGVAVSVGGINEDVNGHASGGGGSETSSQNKKLDDGTDDSQPDLPVDDGEGGNSESDAPPLDMSEEGEQRSAHLERSVSSSVPDLEKKSKQQAGKGLRYRQSATAAVPTHTSDTAEDREVDARGEGGQRIEAASGDSHPRLVRAGVTPRAFAEARLAHRHALARNAQHQANTSQYDTSYFAMLAISIVTALILLNRLVNTVDWSFLF